MFSFFNEHVANFFSLLYFSDYSSTVVIYSQKCYVFVILDPCEVAMGILV